MLLFIHVLSSALWLGTAATLPFWGNRMNRADHLHTVLGIIDTVFLLKCVFIMGGLMSTLTSGFLLAAQYGFSIFSPEGAPGWLLAGVALSLVIFINSWVIFYFLVAGRRGKRSLMRIVPPIGYTNIGLISLVVLLMVSKPNASQLQVYLLVGLTGIGFANLVNIAVKQAKHIKLKNMSAYQFANLYFGFLNEEKMIDLLKLFRDDARFNDPFATTPVDGILAIERFFQKLGDQFDTITIRPREITGEPDDFLIVWEANGITQNGEPMNGLVGTNNMKRKNGKISTVNIHFNLNDLPQIQRVVL